MKITDQGLRWGWLPGLARTVPFDEITEVEFEDNGQGPRLVVSVAGGKPLVARGGQSEQARVLANELIEILRPEIATPGRLLAPDEIQNALDDLCRRRGARPSVILRFVLDQAQRYRATDLHLESMGDDYLVRFRVDGMLHDLARVPPSIKARLIAHIKGVAGLASYKHDVPQEGRLTHAPDGAEPIELRLSVAPTHGEESLVLRLFDFLRGSLALDSLGFSESVRADYERLLERPRGLALLSGPSSSGKTTTIYASLTHMMEGARAGQRAVSLEDPIEFPLACVSQLEVAEHKRLTFDRLFANVLRQDAEVIMVGEIRDEATAAIAVRAALTGHLIISTVHCGSAAEAARRMLNLRADPTAVAEALTGVLAQRLLRTVCPRCGVERPLTEAEREAADAPAWLETIREGPGCERCMGSGYFGRTAVAELLTVTDEISHLIEGQASTAAIRDAAGDAGMTDLRADAFAKAGQGLVSLAEIRRVLS